MIARSVSKGWEKLAALLEATGNLRRFSTQFFGHGLHPGFGNSSRVGSGA
jgi:hypothetical protein